MASAARIVPDFTTAATEADLADGSGARDPAPAQEGKPLTWAYAGSSPRNRITVAAAGAVTFAPAIVSVTNAGIREVVGSLRLEAYGDFLVEQSMLAAPDTYAVRQRMFGTATAPSVDLVGGLAVDLLDAEGDAISTAHRIHGFRITNNGAAAADFVYVLLAE